MEAVKDPVAAAILGHAGAAGGNGSNGAQPDTEGRTTVTVNFDEPEQVHNVLSAKATELLRKIAEDRAAGREPTGVSLTPQDLAECLAVTMLSIAAGVKRSCAPRVQRVASFDPRKIRS